MIYDPACGDLRDKSQLLELLFHQLAHKTDKFGLFPSFPSVLHQASKGRALSNGLVFAGQDLLPQGVIQDVDSFQKLVAGLFFAVQLRVLVTESVEVVAKLIDELLVVGLTANKLNEVPLGLAEQRKNATSLLHEIVENLQGVSVIVIEEALPVVDALLFGDFVPWLVLLRSFG